MEAKIHDAVEISKCMVRGCGNGYGRSAFACTVYDYGLWHESMVNIWCTEAKMQNAMVISQCMVHGYGNLL